MESVYTVERVFLGLHKEYLENIKKINKLKEYCLVKDKKILDYYFMPIVDYKTNYEILSLIYDKEPSKLILLIDKIKSMLNLYRIRVNAALFQEENGEYKILNPKFPIQVNEEDLEDFSALVKLIFDYDFIKNMNTEGIKLESKDNDNFYTIDIISSRLAIYYAYTLIMHYAPYYNTVSFKNHKGILNNAYIEKLLNMNVPTSSLSPYELEVISKSDTEGQRIIIPEKIEEEGKVSFNIYREKEGLILTREK